MRAKTQSRYPIAAAPHLVAFVTVVRVGNRGRSMTMAPEAGCFMLPLFKVVSLSQFGAM